MGTRMDLKHALAILEAARERAGEEKVRTAEVKEALVFLYGRGVEKKALRWFWNSCDTDNDIGRWQNVNASLNRIRWLLSGGD